MLEILLGVPVKELNLLGNWKLALKTIQKTKKKEIL